jgi:GNAT superfamily N-acetyltransferase
VIEGEGEGDLVGGLIVRADPEARLAAVVSLTVEPDYRRHGLGTRLLDWAIRYAEASAWIRVVVPLERGNEGAAAFLTAAGFEDSGLCQPYYHSAGEGTLWRFNLKTEQPE